MIYRGKNLRELIFPLGGIGSGSIGLAGNGNLVNFEIYNHPAKGTSGNLTGLFVRAEATDGTVQAAALCGDAEQAYSGVYGGSEGDCYGHGMRKNWWQGYPHFRSVAFKGEFPIAELRFQGGDFPGKVSLTAFNPFIPLDDRNSSLPAAFFAVNFENDTEQPLTFSGILLLGSPYATCENSVIRTDAMTAIQLKNVGDPAESPSYGDLCVAAWGGECHAQQYLFRGGWCDPQITFWNELISPEGLSQRQYDQPGAYDRAAVWAKVQVAPGEKKTVRFLISWNHPNYRNDWNPAAKEEKSWKNYYATQFQDSLETATYCVQNSNSLFERTDRFRKALHRSSLPPAALDAVASNLAILHSSTVLRLEDGSFYGWEGVHEKIGSCEGSCTHVWNYAYALPFLFPKLEQSMRENDYRYNLFPDGSMRFRLPLPLGAQYGWTLPCVDGQMGGIIKVYREWKISGDDAWLKNIWPQAKKSLEYAWNKDSATQWDPEQTGVLSGNQHHTLDMQLLSPSSWLEGFYLASLQAAAEIETYLGQQDDAATYRALFAKGSKWTEKNLFNGSWYYQKIDLKDKTPVEKFQLGANYWNEETGEVKYQIGEGCEIDQMVAQWHANICGLGDIFDPSHRKTAEAALYRHNFKKTMRQVANAWRCFAVNDESATVMCDYPAGTQVPSIPIPYSSECMNGFEYAAGALLISDGMLREGMELVSAVRNRYDGEKRNPYSEMECGSNYARSMASYSLLPLFSGFSFDLPHHRVGFAPLIKQEQWSFFFSLAPGWGTAERKKETFTLRLWEGTLPVQEVHLPFLKAVSTVKVDGKPVVYRFEKGVLYLPMGSSFRRLTVR